MYLSGNSVSTQKKDYLAEYAMITETLPKLITEDEMIRECKGKGQSLEYLQANYAQIVKEVEAEYGPHVPSIYLHLLPKRGRPRSGEPVELVKTKSVRMPPAFWDEMQGLASNEGLTVHTAMRTALIEWVERRHAVRHV